MKRLERRKRGESVRARRQVRHDVDERHAVGEPVARVAKTCGRHGAQLVEDGTYQLRHGLAPLTSIDAAGALADIADGIALVASLPAKPERVACGPFDRDLFVGDATGGQLLAPGLWAIAYAFDKGTLGARMTMRHFICSPESITGVQAAPSETFYFAYALFELLAGREPFPAGDELGYMTAIRDGTKDRLEVLRPELPRELSALVDRALSPSPGERPPLTELAATLRALAPSPTSPTSPTSPSTALKPWWRFW